MGGHGPTREGAGRRLCMERHHRQEPVASGARHHGDALERPALLRPAGRKAWRALMTRPAPKEPRSIRACPAASTSGASPRPISSGPDNGTASAFGPDRRVLAALRLGRIAGRALLLGLIWRSASKGLAGRRNHQGVSTLEIPCWADEIPCCALKIPCSVA